MRIGIFTPRSINPLHPRLILFQEYFKASGIQVDFINQTDYSNKKSRINWLTLWFFDLHAIKKCKKLVNGYDLVIINDLRYLPLAKYAHGLNKTVVYDTIDHNVFLRFYQLEQRIPAIKPFKSLITSYFTRLEKKYTTQYCHEVLVNSDSLFQYFDQHATVLYYSSPLESLESSNNPKNPVALLYLGIFSREKGAVDILELQRRTNLPLFIFGDVGDPELAQTIKSVSTITHTLKLSIKDLKNKLQELMKTYFLTGFSLIQAPHYSYEVQEANKDIDYLAMGIPLIGNTRIPTKEKIDQGCGIFFHDPDLIRKIQNPETLAELSKTCLKYYTERYASHHFNEKLKGVLQKYLPA